MKNKIRQLDNVAKLFSLDDKKNKSVFRYSVVLKECINSKILKLALEKTMKKYESFKVKMSKGIFWNYLEENKDKLLVKKDNRKLIGSINNKENNNFLFKVTYYKNKINLDIFHVLTDGVGASNFLKTIIYNYLNIKNNLIEIKDNQIISAKDQYIANYNKKYNCKFDFKKAFLLKQEKKYSIDNIHTFTINVDDIKKISKYYNVTITEYLTAIYIYSLYLAFYNSKTKREIVVTVPINLRNHYKVNTLSNFFTAMNINPGILKNKLHNFDEILKEVVNEFKLKLNNLKIKQYLSRDVKIGKNIPISIIPLEIKKFAMKYFGNTFNSGATTTLSNVGNIDIDKEYIKYIDNIYLYSNTWKLQKIKCSVCTYNNKLNITINSIVEDCNFNKIFYSLLKKEIPNVKCLNI